MSVPEHHHAHPRLSLLTSKQREQAGPVELAVTPLPSAPADSVPAEVHGSNGSNGSGGRVIHGGPPLPNPVASDTQAKLLRRSSMSVRDSGLAHSTLQRAASSAGSATKLNLLSRTLQSYADESGHVDFAGFREAFASCLEIDSPLLLSAYFRAFEPKVSVATVMGKLERLTSGTVRDALAFSFASLDEDGDGFVDSRAFVELAVATIKGDEASRRSGAPSAEETDQDKALREKLETLFKGKHGDWGEGRLSKLEFEEFALAHEDELNRLREEQYKRS